MAKRLAAKADWPAIYKIVKGGLQDGNPHGDTLVNWFWQLEQAESSSTFVVSGGLGHLQHQVMQRMSECLPVRPVELKRLVKEENKLLCPARLRAVREHGGTPIVVLGRPEDAKVKLRDGHHRVENAEQDGYKRLPAVWIHPRKGSGM